MKFDHRKVVLILRGHKGGSLAYVFLLSKGVQTNIHIQMNG